ncbi:MAG: DNA-binding protein [Phycisphaerae bacterium SM23_33]|nr:MAG: DNA-binding protein [Phycisphaerae bacterium SM23_33]
MPPSRNAEGDAVAGKRHEEWLKQADYDMDTAEFMLGGGRYFYAVFMCHLAAEKAVKGLYQAKLGKPAPKSHNLVLLLSGIGIKPPEGIAKFVARLNQASVATRYPDNIAALQARYGAAVTKAIVSGTKEALEWIKKQF